MPPSCPPGPKCLRPHRHIPLPRFPDRQRRLRPSARLSPPYRLPGLRPDRTPGARLIVILVILLGACVCCAVAGVVAYNIFAPVRSEVFESITTETVNQIEEAVEPTEQIEETQPPEITEAPTEQPTVVEPAPSPTETTPPPALQPNVAFEGVSFYLDPRIASSAAGQILPAEAGADTPIWGLAPERLSFSFTGYPVTDHIHRASIEVYPVEAFAQINPEITATVTKLQDVLGYQPVINPVDGMPFLPMLPAAQVMATQISYLKFANGSGARYLTQFAQDVYPIHNKAMFYTFQGITDDGKWYIAAIFPASTPVLPDPDAIAQAPDFYDTYLTYLDGIVTILGELPAASFTPDLSTLDGLIQSLVVQK